MPFNPDEAAKKLGLDTNIQSAGSATSFDPDKAAQALGLQTLPNKGGIQNGASTADKLAQTYQDFAPVAGQGAALGFGRQANAGLQAAMGAVDQTVNGTNNFGDQSTPNASLFQRAKDALSNFTTNYKNAKQGVSEQIQKTREAHPVASALTEIASSIAPAYLAGQVLPGAAIAQAGQIGAAYGYGQSDREGVDRAVDAAKTAGISMATAGAFQILGKGIKEVAKLDPSKYLEYEYADYNKPVEAVQKMTASTPKGDPYALDLKTNFGDQFRIGRDMQAVLTNPQTQLAITQELNSQPKVVQSIIDKTREQLGQKWEPILKDNGAAPTDVEGAFKNAYGKIQGLFTEGNDLSSKLKDGLQKQVQTVEESLLAKSPTGRLKDVPLSAVADAQEQLGQIIFKQKAFQSQPGVNGVAKSFFGDISKAFNTADETVGSGGELSNINKVFHSLYNMEDNVVNGSTIKSLTDPQAAAAHQKWSAFTEPFQKLDPQVRDTLAPDVHDYLANQFPKTLAKAKAMLLATERGAAAASSGKQILSLAGLKNLTSSAIANTFNKAGVAASVIPNQSAAPSLGALNRGAQSALPVVAPSVGALSTQRQPEPAQRSLRELK